MSFNCNISNRFKIILTSIFDFQVEEKEKKEESKSRNNIKKPPAKFYKQEDIRRIVPIIDNELKKKIEKANIVSKDKKEGIKKHPKVSLKFFTY